eukprot:COSAG02_NODE_14128_length_1307_cov_0.940397_3_plen_93_part_01
MLPVQSDVATVQAVLCQEFLLGIVLRPMIQPVDAPVRIARNFRNLAHATQMEDVVLDKIVGIATSLTRRWRRGAGDSQPRRAGALPIVVCQGF